VNRAFQDGPRLPLNKYPDFDLKFDRQALELVEHSWCVSVLSVQKIGDVVHHGALFWCVLAMPMVPARLISVDRWLYPKTLVTHFGYRLNVAR
jgi:hypothetical protein